MKFGLWVYGGKSYNLGDFVQLNAIRQIYNELGINEDDLVIVDSLSEYDGEYVILPINMNATPTKRVDKDFEAGLDISPKIIPVFWGLSIPREWVALKMEPILKKYEPIGCRDLYTLKLLRKLGIQAYVSGCGSICVDTREGDFSGGPVVLYDAPQEILPFIPNELMENSITLESPIISIDVTNSKERLAVIKKAVDEELSILRNASLVITRRMHVAMPCVGMNVPVVASIPTCDGKISDRRTGGVDRLVRFYRTDEYDDINWSPKVENVEAVKQLTIKVFKKRICEAYEKWNDILSLSEIYEADSDLLYFEGGDASYLTIKQKEKWLSRIGEKHLLLEEIIKKKLDKAVIVFYGAGDKSKWAYHRYFEYIKRSEEFHVVDSSVDKIGSVLKWDLAVDYDIGNGNRQLIVEHPDIINTLDRKKIVVIITANHYYDGAGIEIGNLIQKKYGLREEKNFFFLDKLDRSMELGLSDSTSLFFDNQVF